MYVILLICAVNIVGVTIFALFLYFLFQYLLLFWPCSGFGSGCGDWNSMNMLT